MHLAKKKKRVVATIHCESGRSTFQAKSINHSVTSVRQFFRRQTFYPSPKRFAWTGLRRNEYRTEATVDTEES